MAKTILFDFDGTIADTVPAGVLVFNQLAREYDFSEITSENSDLLREKSPRAAMRALSVSIFRVPLVIRSLRQGITLALPGLKVLEGMKPLILTLKERGYHLAIISTNSSENVNQFLANNQMEYFDAVQGGVGLFRKASAIKKFILRQALKHEELIFVGDEIRDVEAAKKNNIVSVGVTWGVNSRRGLESAEPDFIIDTAPELLEIIGK